MKVWFKAAEQETDATGAREPLVITYAERINGETTITAEKVELWSYPFGINCPAIISSPPISKGYLHKGDKVTVLEEKRCPAMEIIDENIPYNGEYSLWYQIEYAPSILAGIRMPLIVGGIIAVGYWLFTRKK